MELRGREYEQIWTKSIKNVEEAVHKYKHHRRYKSREQAIAVGLSKTRKEGGKAPKK